jgi:hypothetical protein
VDATLLNHTTAGQASTAAAQLLLPNSKIETQLDKKPSPGAHQLWA